MKTIGVIGALEEEISLLKSRMEIISAKQIIGVDFSMGRLDGKSVIIAGSRIGKVNAAICTQVLIDLYGVDYIINTGAAGAIDKDLQVGDVVISSDLVHHDFDVTPLGFDPGVNNSLPESSFKADDELIRIAKTACEAVIKENNIYVGRIATGDQFIDTSEGKQRISKLFKAYCTEMEGAAIAQTCFLNKIPFIVIRAISDKSDESALVNFNEFLQVAAKNSCEVVEHMLKML